MSEKAKESEVITLESGGTFVNTKTLIDFLQEHQEELNFEEKSQNYESGYKSGYYDGLQFTINKMEEILDEYQKKD